MTEGGWSGRKESVRQRPKEGVRLKDGEEGYPRHRGPCEQSDGPLPRARVTLHGVSARAPPRAQANVTPRQAHGCVRGVTPRPNPDCSAHPQWGRRYE